MVFEACDANMTNLALSDHSLMLAQGRREHQLLAAGAPPLVTGISYIFQGNQAPPDTLIAMAGLSMEEDGLGDVVPSLFFTKYVNGLR